jgi:hypothetical protein
MGLATKLRRLTVPTPEDEELAREMEVVALMKRAMDPADSYTGEDQEDTSEVSDD